jgi:hypothetical protein
VPSPLEPGLGAAQPKPNVRKTLDTTRIKSHLDRVVRGSVEGTLSTPETTPPSIPTNLATPRPIF